MKRTYAALLVWLGISVQTALGQAPALNHASPSAAVPGQAVDVTLHGSNLDGVTGVWTSFAATAEYVVEGSDASKAIVRVTLPPEAPVGIGGVRLATGRGISNLRLLMVDDLSTVTDNGTNKTIEQAQELELPVAVDGIYEAESYDYYKFFAAAGQRVSLDVVARRLGSPLDPVIRLLDEGGREVVYSDDEAGIGADCRFAYMIPADGAYVIELRDIRYQGGGGHRYRLRVGDFPLTTVPFPMGGRRASTLQLELLGPSLEGVSSRRVDVPADESQRRVWVSAKNQSGHGSGFTILAAGDLPEAVEFEPNDTAEQASPVTTSVAINGRFQAPEDRDYYQFDAKKDQRFRLIGVTRSLGAPSDLFMRLFKADGAQVAEAEDSGTSEGIIDYQFPEDGTYRLMVEDLHRRGGAEYAYRIEVRPHSPGFSLNLETDKFDVPQGGVFVAKVTSGRRDYNGPITLGLEGLPEGFAVSGNVIPEGKNETTMRVTAPMAIEPGRWFITGVNGRAKIGESDVVARASTLGRLRGLFAGLPYPPEELNGSVGLGVGQPFGEFFKLALASDAVRLPQLVGTAPLKVTSERLNKFDGPINLTIEGLPSGVTAEAKPIEKGKNEIDIAVTGPAALAEGDYRFRIVGNATHQNQPKRVTIEDAVLRIVPPLELTVTPEGTLAPGSSQKIKIQLTRYGEEKPAVSLEWQGLPAGITAPKDLAVAEGQDEVEFQLSAAADAAVGPAANVTVVASTTIKNRNVRVESVPVAIDVTAAE